jgi:metallo-beta-lactamase family protein
LKYIQSVEESKALNHRKELMIIISASGMAEAGCILHHLKNNIEDSRNTILIVGWQASYTLGRRLADQEPVVKIFGGIYQRRAAVITIGGLSAHAGQDLLTQYALAAKRQVKQIILVHGETEASSSFQDRLRLNGLDQFIYPNLYSSVDI